ncbi:hypothetical protein PFISCL1PPCAC_2319 [Pristionchus fissidentatus]|uniref:G protein-coupled receptor n=1 Tax=Pristionchus fissidentatus TaxID=1538716 RepID=A0AAV5UXL2_9BILA|nr:hypothetical protein PFISCL1PPCAC_2319 [Pristionchus fissidentatus]
MGVGDVNCPELDTKLVEISAVLKGRSMRMMISLMIYFLFHIPIAVVSTFAYVIFDVPFIFIIASSPLEFFLSLPVSALFILFNVCCRRENNGDGLIKGVSAFVDLLTSAHLTRFVLFTIGTFLELCRVANDNSSIYPHFLLRPLIDEGVDVSMLSACWLLCLFHSIVLLYLQSTVKKLKLLMEAFYYVTASLNNPEPILKNARKMYDSSYLIRIEATEKRDMLGIYMSILDIPVIQKIVRAEKYMCMGIKAQSFGWMYALLPLILLIDLTVSNTIAHEELKISNQMTSDWLYLVQLALLQVCLPLAYHCYCRRYIGNSTKLALILLVSFIIHKVYFFIPIVTKWTVSTMKFLAYRTDFKLFPDATNKNMREDGMNPFYLKRDIGRLAVFGIKVNKEMFVLVVILHCFYTFLCLAMRSRKTITKRGTVVNNTINA